MNNAMMIAIMYICFWLAWWGMKWMNGEAAFKWYDGWIGAYYDTGKKRLYICPLPFFVFWYE